MQQCRHSWLLSVTAGRSLLKGARNDRSCRCQIAPSWSVKNITFTLRAMDIPTKGLPPSKFRLLQEAATRVGSVASTGSAPGSTRLGQGMAAAKKWMKLDAQGVVSYVKVKLLW